VATLRRLGLDTKLRSPNEIEVNNQRIAGVGGGRIGEAAVVVGNILFDFDYDAMSRVWRAPSETFRELARQALQDHVTTLRRLQANASMETAQTILVEEFAQTLGRPLEAGDLTPAEENRARELAKRMTSEEYLNLHRDKGRVAPMDSLKISASVFIRANEVVINGRTIRASFRVNADHVAAVRFESFPPQNWQKYETALRGMPFSEWQNFLDRFFRVAATIQLSGLNISRN
jgi:lipoate-protein ligase A